MAVSQTEHQAVEDARRVLERPTARRTGRPAEPGKAGHDAVKRAGRVGVGEGVDDMAELIEGAGPPMNEEEWEGGW